MKIQTPDWVKHAVFYQIFPDRFQIGQQPQQRLLKNPQWEEWSAPPTQQGYKGGDLWGVIEKLDYLKDLGINAIYFTPIFQSTCNHRYHTHDYYQIDPMLGGNRAFEALLTAAHQRDIKIVLDGVFNHASRGFFFFNDILENGPNSPWLDWFTIYDWPLSAYDGTFPQTTGAGSTIGRCRSSITTIRDVKEYIMQIAEYWIKVGVDGWRLDVPLRLRSKDFGRSFEIGSRQSTLRPISSGKSGRAQGTGSTERNLMA